MARHLYGIAKKDLWEKAKAACNWDARIAELEASFRTEFTACLASMKASLPGEVRAHNAKETDHAKRYPSKSVTAVLRSLERENHTPADLGFSFDANVFKPEDFS